MLFASVDGITVGGLTEDEATKKLDEAYANTKLPVYLSDDSSSPKVSPTLSDIGMRIENEGRIASLNYPWYWRVVPTSGLWYHLLLSPNEPAVARSAEILQAYVNETFGEECRVEPVNASIVFKEEALVVVPEKSGSLCEKKNW